MSGIDGRILGISLLLVGVWTQSGNKDLFSKFHQNDYRIVNDRCELVRFNKKYSDYAHIRTFKFNRTTVCVNATFNIAKGFGNDLQIAAQVYKFMSNEYRYFPIHLQVRICDILNQNLMGFASYVKCGNFTGCPLNKGTYHICNFGVDESQFPPLIPSGKYKIEFKGFFNGDEVFVVDSYGAVVQSEV